MSQTLRILLLVAAVATAFWILFKIRRLKVKMEDAIFWTVFALILCVLGLFPEVTYFLTRKMGVMSPANLIFLIMIFLLFEKVFTLSIIVSMLEEKITVLSAEIALRTHQSEKAALEASKDGGTREISGGDKEIPGGVKELSDSGLTEEGTADAGGNDAGGKNDSVRNTADQSGAPKATKPADHPSKGHKTSRIRKKKHKRRR